MARAVELAARAEEHAGLVRRLEAMPAVLPRLSGEELEQVERLQDQIDGWSERDRRLEGKLDAARAKRRDARLPAPIESADLAVWRERADELGRRELALTNARTELGERLEELRTALGSLGGSDLEKAAFTLDEHARLFEFLREAEDHRAGQRAIELRIKLLEKVDDEERASSEGIRPEDLRSAVETLRRWLRSPAPGEHGAGARARRMWLLSALAVMLAGAGLAWIADPRAGLLLLAAGAGLIAPVLLMGRARRDGAARAEAEAAFARLGIPPPDAWDVPSTEARLRTLEEAVARVKREELRAVDQQGLKSDLSALAEKAAVLDGTRKRLLEDLGLAAMSPDAELVDTARALDRLRGARIAHERAAGRVKDFEGTYSGLLADLAAFLREHGEREPEDASSAKAYLGRLADRNAQLEAAISRERQAASERKSLAADRKAARRSTRQIYEKASLDDGDLPVLRDLVSQLEDFRTLHRTVFGLESQNKGDREALEEAGELGLAELDEASLRRLEEVLLADAERAEKLRKKLAGIDAEVKEARRAGSLQDLIARQEEARAELRERRDEVIFAEAGRLLINTVEREYEQTQMPRVFERARAHFSTFTHHGYELRLGRDSKSPRLFATDLRSGGHRELDELSDGTRAQLLLAARVAFAEEVEGGLTLPLFLDEALDQSDPARFGAIAGSLGRIAEDQGRQVFYLTSDPLDRERIRRALAKAECAGAEEIDLGAVRGRGTSDMEPDLQVPPRPGVPAPVGVTAAEYGNLLGVPPLAPGLGHSRQHFFHLLSDDLALLHTLLEDRIERVGQWETVEGSPLAARIASRSRTAEQIGARVRLLEVFCGVWSQGRGRPVGRDALAASGAVSGRYLDGAVEVVRELQGDPVRLLAALRGKGDARLKGFRQRKADTLEEYLRDGGYIDDRAVLEDGDVRLRALASPPANELPDGVAGDLLDRWLAWAVGLAGRGP